MNWFLEYKIEQTDHKVRVLKIWGVSAQSTGIVSSDSVTSDI